MLKSLLRNRIFLSIVPLLFALLCLRLSFLRTDRIGDFRVPIPRGWQREVHRKSSFETIFFSKDDLRISLRWEKARSSNPPKTLRDLQTEERKNTQSFKILNTKYSLNATDQEVESTPKAINGMPALLTHHIIKNYVSRSHGRRVLQTTFTRRLRLTTGSNYYVLHAYISATSPVSQQEFTDLDNAWKEIVNSLKS